jgi:hypothetical protein
MNLRAASSLRSSVLVGGCLLLASCGGSNSAKPAQSNLAGTAAMGAVSHDPAATPDTSIESTEPWSYNSTEGRLVRTAHYRLFTTQADTVLNARIPAFLESALAAYRTQLTTQPLPEPDLKLDTYILRSRNDWALLTRQMTGDQADLFLRIQRGGFAFGGKALLFDIGSHDTVAIVAHEGWHQYTQRSFKRPLPVWLEEGIATYHEGHRFDGRGNPEFLPWLNPERFDQLRKAAAGGRIKSLPALLDSAPQNLLVGGTSSSTEALDYYAQVWALTLFLAEGGADQSHKYRIPLNTLLADAASGEMDKQLIRTFGKPDAFRLLMSRRGPGVFIAYFGDLTQAADEYDRFIKRLVHPGFRGPIIAGQSPFATEAAGQPASR